METTVVTLKDAPVSEDGILIDPTVLKKFDFKTYDQRVIALGATQFPSNVYGG